MKTKLALTLLMFCAFTLQLSAQVKESEVLLRKKNGIPKSIHLNETKIDADDATLDLFLKAEFQAPENMTFSLAKAPKTDELNFTVRKLKQFYKGVPVEFGQTNVVSKNGILTAVAANYVQIEELETKPQLSEREALQFALTHIGAKKYMWEDPANETFLQKEQDNASATFYPKGELVIVEKDMFTDPKPVLAYKFDIYAQEPLSRKNYYVDANTGKVVLSDATIKHVLGPATTRYSGQRNIETQANNGTFRLWDVTRGNGIRTFNMNNGGNYGNATDLTDNNNNWTAGEHNAAERALLDAHWGAMETYDYFDQVHNRNSIDGNGFRLLNYANTNLPAANSGFTNSDNAFWDGNRMTYGAGTNWNPLVSIDVIAHEIGHGLDEFTSDLVYQNESGAIDESLSDIWGAMVELRAAPEKNHWLMAEDVITLRSMSNPNAFGDPDTYLGNNWEFGTNDNGGVHTNSGVMNHWFYLLSDGSAATDEINDNGDQFSFNGIGTNDAARIVYRAQTVYFTSNTTYAAARNHTVRAAEDLFGVNSIEAITTNNAWYAVGIGNLIAGDLSGDVCACRSPNTTFNLTNYTNANVTWTVSSNLEIVSSSNTAITVRATSSWIRAAGFVTANVGGEQVRRDIWVGKPATPTANISGPSSVLHGALVNYTGQSLQGATSYKWYLPYPYITHASVTVDPPKWGILYNAGTSRFLNSIAGPNNGLVQFMGVNKCGTGGAKIKSVSVSSSGGGGRPGPGGGNMPFLPATIDGRLSLYPNPVADQLTVLLGNNPSSEISILALDGRVVRQINTQAPSYQVNTSKLADGVYFVKISGEQNALMKLVVKH
ncbi:MAG: M4 family metallopeptidase [Bacteroidota bacterium]